MCMVRGEHLTKAVSRAQHYFEVLFKDKRGRAARAVDLDVFVEPVPPGSPRNRRPAEDPTVSAAEPAPPEEREGSSSLRKKREKGSRTTGAHKSKNTPTVIATSAAIASVDEVITPALQRPPADGNDVGDTGVPTTPRLEERYDPEQKSGCTTRFRMIRVKVGDKPLIVRADAELSRARPCRRA